MKFLIAFLAILITLTEANSSVNICKCEKANLITAPPVTQVNDIGDKILQFIKKHYKNATDPFVVGLQLNFKGAEDSEFEIDEKNKCFRTALTGGMFEVDGNEFKVDIVMTGQGSDIGPVNTVCDCKQHTGKDKLDFCNVFLRERIFGRVIGIACKLAQNKPNYCLGY